MTIKPQNLEEKLVWYYLIGTYVWYFLGAQYVLGPLLAWFLTLYLCKKLWTQTDNTPPEEKITISSSIWVWIISMLIIAFTLVIGHINFDLGIIKIITSTISFSRYYALMALFPLIGCLKIRPKLIYRAVCIVVLQSIVFTIFAYVASLLDMPERLYFSPLRIAGNNPLFYEVRLYVADLTEDNQLRMALFAPWCPALGVVANIYFFLAAQESNINWRWIGMIGSVLMIAVSVSRASLICLPVTLFLTWLLVNFTQPIVQITVGLVSFFTGILASQFIDLLANFRENFDSARPQSSKVRKILGEIAISRWWNEAPVWGHGIQDYPGPKLVEYMPIGSHHTWIGLLFTHGLVGFIALAVPFVWSFIDLLIKAQKSKIARTGLSIVIVLFISSFADNLEALAYLYWPGLLLMGIAFQEVVEVTRLKYPYSSLS